MKVEPGRRLRLLKSLYGLNQAPRKLHPNFFKSIKSLRCVESVFDNCLFVLLADGEISFLIINVDDILICATNTELLAELLI